MMPSTQDISKQWARERRDGRGVDAELERQVRMQRWIAERMPEKREPRERGVLEEVGL